MNSSIGTKIKTFRLQKNISQEALCGEALSRVSLSKIENNKMVPSIPQLKYISARLNVAITTFLYEGVYEDYMNTSSLYTSILRNMYERKEYYEIVKYYEFEAEEFKKLQDVSKNFYLGMSFFELEMYGEALKILKKYVSEYMKFSEAIQENDVVNFAHALNTLFKIMLRNSNYVKGEHYLVLARKYLYRYKKDKLLINFIIHSNLAYIYLELTKYSKAILLVEDFFRLNYKLVPVDIVANLHMCLNIAYYNMESYIRSIEHIRKSIWLFSYLGHYHYIGSCYINYINSLRYSGQFLEAFEILNRCKKDFAEDGILSVKFSLQEMVLYFNLNKYDKVIELSKKIKLSSLKGITKYNYYFLLGHINYKYGDYEKAIKYLPKCEKGFLKENYILDLKVLYDDLYEITKDSKYHEKNKEFADKINRKNIII